MQLVQQSNNTITSNYTLLAGDYQRPLVNGIEGWRWTVAAAAAAATEPVTERRPNTN